MMSTMIFKDYLAKGIFPYKTDNIIVASGKDVSAAGMECLGHVSLRMTVKMIRETYYGQQP